VAAEEVINLVVTSIVVGDRLGPMVGDRSIDPVVVHNLYYFVIMLLILLLFSSINKHPYVCVFSTKNFNFIFIFFILDMISRV